MEVIDEQLDTIGRTFLGLTIGCARCHDHKFDPIPTRDYYALAGIFRSTKSLVPGNVSGFVTTSLPLPPDEQAVIDEYQAKVKQLETAIAKVKTELNGKNDSVAFDASLVDLTKLPGIVIDNDDATVVGQWTKSTSVKGYLGNEYIHDGSSNCGLKSVTYSPQIPTTGSYEVRISYTSSTNRAARAPIVVYSAEGEKIVHVDQRKRPSIGGVFHSLGKFRFEKGSDASITFRNKDAHGVVIADAVQLIPAEDIAGVKKSNSGKPAKKQQEKKNAIEVAEKRAALKELEKSLADVKKNAPAPAPIVMSVRDEDTVEDCFICIRGNVHNEGEVVPRGPLQVVNYKKASDNRCRAKRPAGIGSVDCQ